MKTMKLITIVLVFVIFALPIRTFTHAQAIERIDPLFLKEVSSTSSWIEVVVELHDLPGIEYWEHQQIDLCPTSNGHHSSLLEDTRHYQNYLTIKQDDFLSWVSRKKLSLIPKHHLTLTLNAITAEIKGNDLAELSTYPYLYKIHDARQKFELIRHLGAKSTGGDKAWAGFKDENIAALSGKKLLIGVMDTGLDTLHPEFSQPGKVKGGYNVAENNRDLSDAGSHGTHVAGIAAGQGSNDKNQGRGIAYDAHVMVYKIFSKSNMSSADVLGAMEIATKDGCDVLNLSFGGSSSEAAYGNSAYHRSMRNADKAGTFVVAGAGNSGARRKEVPWPIIIPSIIDSTFSVAGSDDRNEGPFLTVQINGKIERIIQAIATTNSSNMNTDLFVKGIVDAGYGTKEEISQLHLKDKVALIQRGSAGQRVSFREKLDNATQAGASGVLFYADLSHQNFAPHLQKAGEDASAVKRLLPSISLSKEDGEFIKIALGKQAVFTIDYKQVSTIASFSSMGLSGDSAFKPEITAPATRIVSTIPGAKYAAFDGTSMATPMISGLAALLKEARPGWNHQQIKSAFMNTADIMINPYNHLPISFTLQGAGVARLDNAILTPAFIEPRAVVWSNTDNEVSQTFSVSNATNKRQVFDLSAEFYHLNHEMLPISLSFDKKEISIDARQQESFTITVKMDKNAFLQNRYEGIIRVGSKLHIPIICYRDSGHQVEDAVSNIRLSQEVLDLGPENTLHETPLQISFSLNAGDLATFITKEYTFYNGTNYGSVNIFIADDTEDEWAKIGSFNNIMVGEYTFSWDGKNENNTYFLPKGTFYIHFTMTMREYKNQQLISKTYGPFKKAFQVEVSDIPYPISANLSAFRMYDENDTIKLGIRLDEVFPEMSPEEQIQKIEFKLHYSETLLFYKRSQQRGFLTTASQVDLFVEEEPEGTLLVSIECKGLNAGMLNEQVFLILEFDIIERGRVSFIPRSFLVHTSSNQSFRVKAFPVQSRISNRAFLLCDLNGDKMVDRHDFIIFMESYGSKAGDANYNEKSDFNQDNRIDILDLTIFSREMGKYI